VTFLATQATGRKPSAVRDQQQVLRGSVQGCAGAEGPVEVVGAQPDALEVGAEEAERPGVDGAQDDAQAVLGDAAVEAERDRDVEAVDDVVAQGRRDSADGRLPGVVRVLAEEGGEFLVNARGLRGGASRGGADSTSITVTGQGNGGPIFPAMK
jgi:hypothetical protein